MVPSCTVVMGSSRFLGNDISLLLKLKTAPSPTGVVDRAIGKTMLSIMLSTGEADLDAVEPAEDFCLGFGVVGFAMLTDGNMVRSGLDA